ncbi:MAG TPA: M14 metallopeptidase family protein [Candidatus Acidoferrales bacterium]|nr:M14 metallopeptidase family protein [Candidatus Acidoferrales bacterium]
MSSFLNRVRAMRKHNLVVFVWLSVFASLFYFSLGVARAIAQAPAPSVDPKVPTPVSVLGHTPGDDFYLANYDESRAYFHKLAESSNRIKIYPAGKTTRGLDFEYAVISSSENLAQLDKYKGTNSKLTMARGLDDAAAHELARQGKVIVHLDGGMHSTEVAGAQHSIVLAYKLVATQNDTEIDAILNNVIIVLWPTLNPDGQDEVVAWYRKNLGTRFEVSPLPDLYQEYVGHDNNRDGYMNNMLESQEITRMELAWNPEVFYCQHQTAPFPARIFIPPFVEPISSNIQPLLMRWLNAFGIDMAAYLDEHQMPGAINRVGFDNWYPGFQDFTGIFRNTISFFTETALYGYATPHFYTVRDFPKDYQPLNSQIFYSSPWEGGWWRLGDAVHYMVGASMSVLDTAAKYHEQLLYNKYQAGRDNIERFEKNPPYAYVISTEQRDLPEAATLAQKMMLNGIEVNQATQPFAANDRKYSAGSWVILMDQPYAGLVKELFEPQKYPDLRENGTPIRPYDVAGWTLPMQMGVDADAVMQPLTREQLAGLKPLTEFAPPAGSVEGTGSVFLISHRTNNSFKAINDAFAAGGQVSFTSAASANGGEAGTIVVSGVSRERMGEIAKNNSLVIHAAERAPQELISTKKPRVGLYRSWTPNIDEGWTRWILEKYGFAPITLHNGDIQASHLQDEFDAIILPDEGPNQILNGFSAGSVPGEYVGGVGETGVAALREFVQEGGTLIAFNNASLFAIEQLGLPVTNVLAGLKQDEFYCSGSLLRVELRDVNQPGLWGMPSDPDVMFENGPAFAPKPGFHGTVLASYPENVDPLASGYLLHPEKIEGKAAAMEVGYGNGRVYLFGFKPQWRGQSHGTYKMIFDAIYDSPSVAKPSTFPKAMEIPGAPATKPEMHPTKPAM